MLSKKKSNIMFSKKESYSYVASAYIFLHHKRLKYSVIL